MIRKTAVVALLIAVIGSGAAQGALLYPSTATDVILSGASGNIDDQTFTPGGAATFGLVGFSVYGTLATAANFQVNNNGFLFLGTSGQNPQASGNSLWVNSAMPWTSSPAGLPIVAPMDDDLFLTGVGTALASKSVRVVTQADPAVYVVTWQGEEVFLNTTPDLTFQAILYGAGNLSGAPAGTITFCYDGLTAGTNAFTFTTGINNGAGSASGIPSIGLGINGNTALATLVDTCHTFVPIVGDGYMYIQGTPEPATIGLLVLGAFGLIRRRR